MTTLLDLWRASRSVLRGCRVRRPDDRVQVTSLNAASMFASAVDAERGQVVGKAALR